MLQSFEVLTPDFVDEPPARPVVIDFTNASGDWSRNHSILTRFDCDLSQDVDDPQIKGRYLTPSPELYYEHGRHERTPDLQQPEPARQGLEPIRATARLPKRDSHTTSSSKQDNSFEFFIRQHRPSWWDLRLLERFDLVRGMTAAMRVVVTLCRDVFSSRRSVRDYTPIAL
jgi:hypothetical protein